MNKLNKIALFIFTIFITMFLAELKIFFILCYFLKIIKNESLTIESVKNAWIFWTYQTDPETGVSSIRINETNVLLGTLGIGLAATSISFLFKKPDNIRKKFLSIPLECGRVNKIVQMFDNTIVDLIESNLMSKGIFESLFKDVSQFDALILENIKEIPPKCIKEIHFINKMINLVCSDEEIRKICQQGFIDATKSTNLQSIKHIFPDIIK